MSGIELEEFVDAVVVMIDEEAFKKYLRNESTTITCPKENCDSTFTGNSGEILVEIAAHYTKYHKVEEE